MNITDQTGIGIGIVMALLGVATTSGMLWQRVADMRREVGDLKVDMRTLFTKIDNLC